VHEPVLLAEVVSLLAVRPDGLYVDATVGLGGHAAALVEAGAGRVIGLDRDPAALAFARERLPVDRVELVHADYRDLPRVLRDRGVDTVDGVLVDLGVSSLQFDDPRRGFSFRQEGPLDMRMDPTSGEPLSARLAEVDERTLADVIYRFGEERQSRRVARRIIQARERQPITTTTELAAIVRQGAGGRGWQRIDPATRTFQALRIWVNQELEGLEEFLAAAIGLLRPGGRLAVIAFHSLEDRVVKHAFRRSAADGAVTALTRRPIVPGDAEVGRNPRARSARLRAVEKPV
jgi:16S rRNA (cytosine1402-N4)-methyltransferase